LNDIVFIYYFFGNCNYISIHQMLWSLTEITLKIHIHKAADYEQ